MCKKGDEVLYVQVVYILTEKNKVREFENLLAIPDNYKKMLISMNNMLQKENEYKGVKHLHIRDFLLSDKL